MKTFLTTYLLCMLAFAQSPPQEMAVYALNDKAANIPIPDSTSIENTKRIAKMPILTVPTPTSTSLQPLLITPLVLRDAAHNVPFSMQSYLIMREIRRLSSEQATTWLNLPYDVRKLINQDPTMAVDWMNNPLPYHFPN